MAKNKENLSQSKEEETLEELVKKDVKASQSEEIKPVEDSSIEGTPAEPVKGDTEGSAEGKETPPEEPEKKPPEPEVEVPLEEVAEEIKEKAREEMKADVLDKLGWGKAGEGKAEEEGYQSLWAKRGDDKPASWDEVAENNYLYNEFKRKEAEEKTKAEEDEKAKAVQANQEAQNQTWSQQLEYLREKGYIPEVDKEVKAKYLKGESLTEEENKDPGLTASRTLFETMNKVATDRHSRSLPAVMDLVHIYHEYYEKKAKPGAAAPVSGGGRSVPSTAGEDMSYEELHAKELEDIVAGT